jgi:O-antigen ligase
MQTLGSFSLARPLFLLGCVAITLAWQIAGHYPPWVAFQQELVAGIGAALIAWAVVALSPRVQWPRLAFFTLLVATVPLLQREFGLIIFTSTALLASLYLMGFALALVTGASIACSGESRVWTDAIMVVLALGACIGAVLALMQWLHVGVPNLWITDLRRGARPYANFAQPNHLATLLAFGIAAFLYGYETRRLGGFAASIGVALLAFALVATQSRTGWVFAGIVVAGGLLLRRREALRVSPTALLVGAVLFTLAVLLWQALNDALLLTTSTPLESRLEVGPRRVLGPLMLEASLRRPWFGYGWTQGGTAQFAAALDFPPSRYFFKSAHNEVLDLVLWNGWPLGLIIVGMLAMWFVRRARGCRDGANAAMLLAIAAAWLHAMVEYPLDYAYFLLPVGLLMGMTEGGQRDGMLATAPRSSLAVPLTLACALTAWVAMEYTQVEASTRVQRFISARVGLDKVSTAPRPHVRLLDAELALFDFATNQPREGMTQGQLDAMKAVVEGNAFPGAVFRYATALGLNDRPLEAAAMLETLCRVSRIESCIEAREAWRELQEIHPQLVSISPPPVL